MIMFIRNYLNNLLPLQYFLPKSYYDKSRFLNYILHEYDFLYDKHKINF